MSLYEMYQTSPDYGYIYVRTNEYWDTHNACKTGTSLWLLERENAYNTSEIKKGKFVLVIRVDSHVVKKIETQLREYFTNLGFYIYLGGGRDFYKKDIIDHIVPYFINNKIKYTVLTENEINELIRNPTIT